MVRIGKLVAVIVAALAAGWLARLVAHSKRPPAEGIWRELPDSELE